MFLASPLKASRFRAEAVWIGIVAVGFAAAAAASHDFGQAASSPAAATQTPRNPPATSLAWRLNNPAPGLVPEDRATPPAVADKFAARERSIEQRASLRAFEGAPPVIPHAIADLHVQTCRECHAQGLRAGNKVARMVSHTYLPNCTQCHVEAGVTARGGERGPENTFAGLRPSGHGGTRAWAGAPPVMPHATFMRTNCVSCHGEHGYAGWRPDHLSRTNCVQCHAPGAAFDQLAPTFGVPDVADGLVADAPR